MKDRRLSSVCDELIRNIPRIESIVLCGSRATAHEDRVSKISDYDIIVVMKSCFVPIYLTKLKALERGLNEKAGAKVNINPLLMFRVQRAKNNLFLSKVKREAITLWGKDFIKSLDCGNLEDINLYWLFFYLFYSMKELVKRFDPSFMSAKLRGPQKEAVVFSSVKALFLYEELSILIHRWQRTVRGAPTDRMLILSQDLRRILNMRGSYEVNNPVELWLKSRDILLNAFRAMMRDLLGSNDSNLEGLIRDYMEAHIDKFFLKNAQYFLLMALLRKEFFPRAFFSHYGITSRIFAALVWLLSSVNEVGDLSHEDLDSAYSNLRGYMNICYTDNSLCLWRRLRDTICLHWSYACTALGF